MKYYICTKSGFNVHIINEIPYEEYIKWRKCTEQLKYYRLAKHFSNIAIENGIEAEQYLKSIQHISDSSIIRKLDTTAVSRKANRLMLNYLVSFKTFVDNLDAYSKHIKGGGDFKVKVLCTIYEKEPVYAFFYHLRNFVTHLGVVFDKMSIEPTAVSLECSKEHLHEYSRWKDVDLKFIESHAGDYLPITPCIEQLNVLIASIYIGFIRCFAAELQDMHNQAISLMHKYQIINPVFIESESGTDFTGASVLGFGLEVLKEATDELAQMSDAHINYVTPEQVLSGNI